MPPVSPTLTSPGADVHWTTRETSKNLTFAEKLELLRTLYENKGPPMLNSIDTVKRGRRTISFAPEAFVREIGRAYFDLTDEEKTSVLSLPWMQEMLALQQKSESGFVSTMYYDKVIWWLAEVAPLREPGEDEKYTVHRRGCESGMFIPTTCLERIKEVWNRPYGPSSKGREQLRSLPWCSPLILQWEAEHRRQRGHNPSTISRKARAKLLCMFYGTKKPTPRDLLPVRLENGEVVMCQPSKWVKSINKAWQDSDGQGLTPKEKEELAKLPWVASWKASGETERGKGKRPREEEEGSLPFKIGGNRKRTAEDLEESDYEE